MTALGGGLGFGWGPGAMGLAAARMQVRAFSVAWGGEALIATPPLAGGQLNKWQDGPAPLELLGTRREFRRRMRFMVSFFAPKGDVGGEGGDVG